jgi:hypothetical protein
MICVKKPTTTMSRYAPPLTVETVESLQEELSPVSPWYHTKEV